jgi:hypothetical protein
VLRLRPLISLAVSEVNVAVDQSWENGRSAQIDHPRTGWNLRTARSFDGCDAVSANDHDLIGRKRSRLRVEQTTGANSERLWVLAGLGSQKAQSHNDEAAHHQGSWPDDSERLSSVHRRLLRKKDAYVSPEHGKDIPVEQRMSVGMAFDVKKEVDIKKE